jgi:GNAT superfamily N-acetyltransferase
MPTMPHEPALLEIARLEERRLAIGVGEVAETSRPCAGGVLCRSEPGSWANAVLGAGMDGPVEAAEIRAAIAFFEAGGVEPRIELCPFADATLVAALAAERFGLRWFETVFFRRLSPDEPMAMAAPPLRGLELRAVEPDDAEAVDRHAHIAISGFLPEGAVASAAMVELSRRMVRHPRMVGVIAWLDGEPVGAGSVEVAGAIAALAGVTVIPSARRRGVQQALVAWRLAVAAQRGARIATIGSRPGSPTERNARRMGFEVAYTKVTLVRPGPGLVPVTE